MTINKSSSDKAPLFPTMTFAPLIFFSYLATGKKVSWEQQENYQKRSLRNRYYLHGSNGYYLMSIPLIKGKNNHCHIKKVRISYDDDWPGLHLKTIQAAYGKSAFFIYYKDDLENLFLEPCDYLWEFNWKCLQFCLSALNIDKGPSLTTQFNANYDGKDYRNAKISDFCADTKGLYTPLNESKYWVKPRPVSVLDLIFCLGPESKFILRQIESDE